MHDARIASDCPLRSAAERKRAEGQRLWTRLFAVLIFSTFVTMTAQCRANPTQRGAIRSDAVPPLCIVLNALATLAATALAFARSRAAAAAACVPFADL